MKSLQLICMMSLLFAACSDSTEMPLVDAGTADSAIADDATLVDASVADAHTTDATNDDASAIDAGVACTVGDGQALYAVCCFASGASACEAGAQCTWTDGDDDAHCTPSDGFRVQVWQASGFFGARIALTHPARIAPVSDAHDEVVIESGVDQFDLMYTASAQALHGAELLRFTPTMVSSEATAVTVRVFVDGTMVHTESVAWP